MFTSWHLLFWHRLCLVIFSIFSSIFRVCCTNWVTIFVQQRSHFLSPLGGFTNTADGRDKNRASNCAARIKGRDGRAGHGESAGRVARGHFQKARWWPEISGPWPTSHHELSRSTLTARLDLFLFRRSGGISLDWAFLARPSTVRQRRRRSLELIASNWTAFWGPADAKCR